MTIQGRFHKGPDHFYTAISPHCARLFGAPEPYLPDMRWHDFTSPAERTSPQLYLEQDRRIIETDCTVMSEALVRGVGGDWVRLFIRRSRADDGGIDGEVSFVTLKNLYNGWFERLDRDREVLPLVDGIELTRYELALLHGILSGLPRKLLARDEGVSLKAMEKRVYRLREKLAALPGFSDSVYRCLDRLGLAQFVMDRDDWFDLTPSFQTYPGTVRRAKSCSRPSRGVDATRVSVQGG